MLPNIVIAIMKKILLNFMMNKPRKISSPLIKKLMSETTDFQKQQVEKRIQLAMDLNILTKTKTKLNEH